MDNLPSLSSMIKSETGEASDIVPTDARRCSHTECANQLHRDRHLIKELKSLVGDSTENLLREKHTNEELRSTKDKVQSENLRIESQIVSLQKQNDELKQGLDTEASTKKALEAKEQSRATELRSLEEKCKVLQLELSTEKDKVEQLKTKSNTQRERGDRYKELYADQSTVFDKTKEKLAKVEDLLRDARAEKDNLEVQAASAENVAVRKAEAAFDEQLASMQRQLDQERHLSQTYLRTIDQHKVIKDNLFDALGRRFSSFEDGASRDMQDMLNLTQDVYGIADAHRTNCRNLSRNCREAWDIYKEEQRGILAELRDNKPDQTILQTGSGDTNNHVDLLETSDNQPASLQETDQIASLSSASNRPLNSRRQSLASHPAQLTASISNEQTRRTPAVTNSQQMSSPPSSITSNQIPETIPPHPPPTTQDPRRRNSKARHSVSFADKSSSEEFQAACCNTSQATQHCHQHSRQKPETSCTNILSR